MGKKSNKLLTSQITGIIWLSIGLLIISGIVFFSHKHRNNNVGNDSIAFKESKILIQKEDSVYTLRQAKKMRSHTHKDYANNDSQLSDKILYTNVSAPQRKQPLSIELNSADTLTLQLLHGIGPTYANRIVRYRERLGGFTSTKQLLEVYGFTPDLLRHIEPHLTLDSTIITRIDINSISLKALSHHPYIEYYQARDIIRLRNMGVIFTTPDDLRAVPSMADSTLIRILPYIDFSVSDNNN